MKNILHRECVSILLLFNKLTWKIAALKSHLFASNSVIWVRLGKDSLSSLHTASDGVPCLWLENSIYFQDGLTDGQSSWSSCHGQLDQQGLLARGWSSPHGLSMWLGWAHGEALWSTTAHGMQSQGGNVTQWLTLPQKAARSPWGLSLEWAQCHFLSILLVTAGLRASPQSRGEHNTGAWITEGIVQFTTEELWLG